LAESGEQQRTLRRIYDINNRLYRGVHQATFAQLNYIHEQFENTIRRLQTLKDLSDSVYNGSRDRLTQTLDTVSKNTLVAQCMSMIDTKNLSIEVRDSWINSSI
jgi:predicted ATPase